MYVHSIIFCSVLLRNIWGDVFDERFVFRMQYNFSLCVYTQSSNPCNVWITFTGSSFFTFPILSHVCIQTLCVFRRFSVLLLQVKTGPFAEHSNTLWGISSVAEWTKVNSGLIKMYKAEVTTYIHTHTRTVEPHYSIHSSC